MDLEIREALALAEDRGHALAQLLPGSEDHDFYRCLHAQHAGALDEADTILTAWPDRHGHTERYDRLRLRQLLYRVTRDPARAADQLRDWAGASHGHEREVEEVDPARPSRLADGVFDGAALLQRAVDHDANLSQVTDEGLRELVERGDRELDATRRKVLLSRLSHVPGTTIVELVAAELARPGSGGFGQLAIHGQLALDQLVRLAELRPELRGHLGWVAACVQRMRPPAAVDLEADRDARAAYLAELWQLVAALPEAVNTLKAHVLYHLLATARQRGEAIAPTLVASYLALPRTASYVPREWRESRRGQDRHLAQLGQDLRTVTGLPPVGDDEPLVRELLHADLDRAQQYARLFDRAWFDAEIATAILLQGRPGAEGATRTLGPARAAALREQVEIAWCAHAPLLLSARDPVALDVDVKHVDQLLVKVFRIDPVAYFLRHGREVDTALDLDGLAASHELAIAIAEPPVRRVRHRIDLPMCARPGTYVIDLIGNGKASRALVIKGRLRHAVRLGAAGHVVTILDEAGTPLPGARAYLGEREYVADERGAIVIPFSTAPGRVPMLLVADELATVAQLDLVRETYQLATNLVLDREALAQGRTATALARVRLQVAGAPASLALLEHASWEIGLVDRAGVTTTKSQPLALEDDAAAVLEWPMGDDVARVTIAIRGVVQVRSEQREQQLADSRSIEVATIHGTAATEALYLARTGAGWVVSALGKSGEPRARRPVTVTLVHRWARTQQDVELATDALGRVELGELPGVESIAVTLGGLTQRWRIGEPDLRCQLAAVPGGELIVPVPAGRSPTEVALRMSLVELRGGVPARHPEVAIEPVASGLVIRGLPPGDHELRAPGIHATIVVAPPGPVRGSAVIGAAEVVDVPRAAPAIATAELGDGELRLKLLGATARTRVHVIATRFASSLIASVPVGPRRPPLRRLDRARSARYVSGRELGDEYRYVLERRARRRYPQLLLDKPSLLLNPWPRRTTTASVATARAGEGFKSYAAAAPAAGAARPAMSRGAPGHDEAYASHDFLPEPPAVLANLAPDPDGTLVVPRDRLGATTTLTIIVDDPAGTALVRAHQPEPALAPRDLRLALALGLDRHATQQRAIMPLVPGARLVIEDLATAQLHLIDSVARAHGYLLALRDDPTLRTFEFVTRWHALADAERRALYSKHACHELNLFVFHRDRAWFDAVIAPYLAHKRTKTFVDHWLLGADLRPYLEPTRLATLNAFELALLARRLPDEPALARVLDDRVALQPPDPETDTRLVDTLLGAAVVDRDREVQARRDRAIASETRAVGASMEDAVVAESAPPAARPAPKKRAKREERQAEGAVAELDDDALLADVAAREQTAPHYRAVDRTQEWAEHNWWHRTPTESGPDMIGPSRLWRDLARHSTADPGAVFLSPWLGLAAGSFAEAMCALAVTELPFVAPAHAIVGDGPRLELTAAGNALAGTSQLVDVPPELAGGAPIVVGTTYVRADDRHDWDSGEPRDKYVEGPFATGVVYTCLVVLANPTSSRQRIAALVQIPRGSIAVAGARPTQTLDVVLEPYETHGHEYSFYFPAPGQFTHYGVHVTRDGAIVAAAPGATLEVSDRGGAPDPRSWAYVSQRGSLAETLALLDTANLATLDLERVAWRLRERAAYDAILGALERRRVYSEPLWAYALLHRDGPRIRTWLRALRGQLSEAGPVLEMLDLDAEALGSYEHLELAPLINARAHRLGPKLRILDHGLAAQYDRFLELVAHRPAPTAEDLLAATSYLVTQDRIDDALAMLGRVRAEAIADRMQHDYLAAYLACVTGELERARELASRWREHPVDRWRHRFGALLAMLDELAGRAPEAVDGEVGRDGAVGPSRDQQHAELAARQPTFELAVDAAGLAITSHNVHALELRFFEMDVELLFSRQPFVQSDVSRFSFIEPGHRERIVDPPPDHRLAWPAALRGKNVVVEAVGHGQRRAKVHYANDLTTSLASHVGQLRVQRASDRAALPATYVKVYARRHGGAIAFHKDGYTDLRGWFDFASLSTGDLGSIEKFAILVCSDEAGATILEASPPVGYGSALPPQL
jgi:hypothetical protein